MTITNKKTSVLAQISLSARRAAQARDWTTVATCANQIIRQNPNSAEGYFLTGLVERASQKPVKATEAFEKALVLDANRYDVAIELANQYSMARRNGEAADLMAQYEKKLGNSPKYLNLAGTVYTDIGMSQKAWPLFKKAVELQPKVDMFQANLATCAVFLGKIEQARSIYQALLKRFPDHRRNHYQLSRLEKAKDFTHIEQMKEILHASKDTPDKQIFLYYAIAKELEDLERWEESFEYYEKAGDAVTRVANYDVATDIELIDRIIGVCNSEWLAGEAGALQNDSGKTPVFIVGLPRTGTTLTERILSSHSRVSSLGETLFLQMILRLESGVHSVEKMTPEMIEGAAKKDMSLIAKRYMDSVGYRLGDEPMVIDKLPFNFLFLGFIARAWPNARIIHLVRNPMDSCFSMYKQAFTWAYKFSYSQEGLGRYFVAYERLRRHWQDVLKDRLIEVEYESLVTDQPGQTRLLLDKLGLEFEQACLEFDKNTAPSTTASSVQVREKVHTDSVNRWTRFARQLQPLREQLESAGIRVE
jgi:tetratricopeptide (TPR) repeat protein